MMTTQLAASLREPFKPESVGKLPRLICRDCSGSPSKVCQKHTKSKCAECGNYITSAHIHLDYVGHAAVTDRLLQVDPGWTYTFRATNEDGSPIVYTSGLSDPVAKIGIWIDLTVCEVTRPGFGEGKNFKEAIGDALRNAAMRFGVGLDLWSKEDLHYEESKEVAKPVGDAPKSQPTASSNVGDAPKSETAPSSTIDDVASESQNGSTNEAALEHVLLLLEKLQTEFGNHPSGVSWSDKMSERSLEWFSKPVEALDESELGQMAEKIEATRVAMRERTSGNTA